MSFVNVGDIAACAKFAYKVYEIGFSKVKNASVQYDEFGQDVYRLHENLKEVGKVFSSVKANARGPIPQDSEFYDTRSLNSILDKPFRTIKECETLLDNRTAFSKDSGFIQNIYWNLTIEAQVTALHNKVKFHNVKIIALLQPLQIKLLLDIKSVVQLYGDNILTKLAALEARIFGESLSPESAEVATRCDQVRIPEFLLQRFEDASQEARPDLKLGDCFPMQMGINAFLIHYKNETPSSAFAAGFLLPPSTQSPEQYLRMIKSIWILQRVQSCAEYIEACGPVSRNRLLQCFVEGLADKCLEEFNRFAQPLPGGIFKVRDDPAEGVLRPLGNEAFSVWPKIVRPPDPFDIASVDSLKIVLRAPLKHQTESTRSKELLLLRHDPTLLEMLTKETSETNQPTVIQTRNIDLKIVSLNPIYADPDAASPNIYIGLHPIGSRGPDALLSFRGYNDMYQFQEAVTGYRPIIDLVDIDILIQEAKATTWRGRAQLWNFQKNQSGPSHNRNNSIASNRDQRLSGVQSRASRTSSSIPTSHSSVMSFQTRTSQLTAVTSVLASENSSNINIDARTFELPKQPLLVLFLRARRQRTREVGQLTLIKIPMGDKSVYLDTVDCCRCHKLQKHECRHSQLTGPKKTFGRNPMVVQQYSDGPMRNLALLGVHHDRRDEETDQKINFINFTFKVAGNREKFDSVISKYQKLYTDKMSAYTKEKSSIRFKDNT